MHEVQQKLLNLIDKKNIGGLTLRDIGEIIDEKEKPQKIKHHLLQLEKKGFIKIDKKNKKIVRIKDTTKENNLFISIPIIGSANCGPAEIFAEENFEGFLKISKKIIKNNSGIFAIKAKGNSLNLSNVNDKKIEDGDYVIVDSKKGIPKNNEMVLTIIDGLANIKKFKIEEDRILLLSESTQEYPPIILHKEDNFIINGKVIDVIKKVTI